MWCSLAIGRAGGVGEWMEIGAIAAAFGVEVASQAAGSLKGESSTVEKLRMVDGSTLAPESAGMGSELRREWVRKFKV